MQSPQTQALRQAAPATDLDLVRRALAREPEAFRAIMQTYNRRLFRIARSIVRSDGEAEDAVQEGYIRAFGHLDGFRGDASLATWLTRIVMNEALGIVRKRARVIEGADPERALANAEIIPFPTQQQFDDPERTMAQREILRLVEEATLRLPDSFRTVFMMRVVEGMSIEETAEALDILPQTVKTRLHRARQLVREQLDRKLGPVLLDAFPFAGRRCERITEEVMSRLGFPDAS